MTAAAGHGSDDDPQEEQARAFVRSVNADHGTEFALAGRLPGGYQTGAYRLIDEIGRPAVLKWWGAPRPLERLAEAAASVAAARAAGWPTPAWLYCGLGPGGLPHEIQEFVPGRHRNALDDGTLDRLLEVNAIQAGLDPPTDHDWSRWALSVVYQDAEGHQGRLASVSPAGAGFVRVVEKLAGELGPTQLPNADLVCGVFALENILFSGDAVSGVIDVGALGRGSRVHDLAVLFSIQALWGPENPTLHRLRREAEGIAGPGVFALCLATEFIGLLTFGLANWADGIDPAAQKAARFLAGIR